MANSYVENDDFFDAPEEINSESDYGSEASEGGNSELQLDNNALESLHSKFWAGHPKSVDERRDEFIRQTGFDLERCLTAKGELDDPVCDHNGNEIDMDRLINTSRLPSRKGKNLVGEATDEGEDMLQVNHGGMSGRFRGPGMKRCATAQDAQIFMSSQSSHRHSMKGQREVQSDVEGMRKIRHRRDWFKKFGVRASNMFSKRWANKNSCNYHAVFGPESERIRVRSHKKWSKELSSLYRIQDFSAHKGSILCMKFSHDGQHLATGGEDGILCIWRVIEDERPPSSDVLSLDSASACLYFSVNGISDFASFLKIKEERNMIGKLKNFLHSACIMLPRKIFHIVEKPEHELCGHEGEILDISWCKEGVSIRFY